MAEVSLAEALEAVQSGTQSKRRRNGIANLKHILRHNQQTTRLEKLKDSSFYSIYEALFACIHDDRSTWIKARTAVARRNAANFLAESANALRVAVESGVAFLRFRTVRAILSHIQSMLLLPTGDLAEPIALDYAKCLRSILKYQPHVEHLTQPAETNDPEKATEWSLLADFCMECIQKTEGEADDALLDDLSDIATTGTSYRSSRSLVKDSMESQDARSLAKQIADEMVACLRLLTAAPNAPLSSSVKAMSDTLIRYLRTCASTGRSIQDAFGALNNILAFSRVENTKWTQQMIPSLLRLIKVHWPVKASSSKDEILATLLLLEPYIFHAVKREGGQTLRADVIGLLETVRNEYARRNQKDQLHTDDLRMNPACHSGHESEVRTHLLSLKCVGPHAESNWALVYLLASLYNTLDSDSRLDSAHASKEDSESEQDGSLRPRKRRRLDDNYYDLVAATTSSQPGTRTCAFQTIAFLVQQTRLTLEQLTSALDSTISGCSDESWNVSSWSFMALACCALQPLAKTHSLAARWSDVWQLSLRALGNASTCRAASYTLYMMLRLHLVQQSVISDFVQLITHSMSLNGPSIVTDSVTLLMNAVLHTAKKSGPNSFMATAESIANALTRLYVPSRFLERSYASSATLYRPVDIVSLINTCLQRPVHKFNQTQHPVWNTVARAWLLCRSQQQVISYLLLDEAIDPISGWDANIDPHTSNADSSLSTSAIETLVMSYLTAETSRINELWTAEIQELPGSTSVDAFTMLCTICCVSTCVANCMAHRNSALQAQLRKQTELLMCSLSGFSAKENCDDEKADAMLLIFSGFLGGLCISEDGVDREITEPSACEIRLCGTLRDATTNRRRTKDAIEGDLMNFEYNSQSQESADNQSVQKPSELLNDLDTFYSRTALRSSIALYAQAIDLANGDRHLLQSPSETSTKLTDYVLAQSEHSIISSRIVMSHLPRLGITLTWEDTDRFLSFFMETVISSYGYERSEVAIGTLLDFMSNLIPVWTSTSHRDLFNLGIDIYEWCTVTSLSNGFLSANCQTRLAILLLRLCALDTDYGRDNDAPSVRTSLFKLIQLGGIYVQFYLSNMVSKVFGLFVLGTHSAMFEDLQKSLPADAEWIEGIAMRLRYLAKLASAWHSLLRPCVYYLFETAGKVKGSAQHAAFCIADLAAQLPLKSPQNLFGLFASQLLHSWLETQSLTDLPYNAFKYTSLDDLLAANESELCAQLIMRNSEEDLTRVSRSLKTTAQDLARRTFGKSLAYAIGRDLSVQPGTATSETFLRNLIGRKEDFKSLVLQHFPTIMGNFYSSLQQQDADNTWLEKRSAYADALTALHEVEQFSSSNRVLPLGQQPYFRSKFLCDQIERLCRRTSHNPVRPWTSSGFVLAARMLLDSIDISLGSLHACLVIRRLRILVCMAGDVASSGYPLEMLIHSLRPFVVDAECADDALGILRYLFDHGRDHLKSQPVFLKGTTVLLILQMKKHSRSRQESTTQESQHRMTIQKMADFQDWLVKYLSAMASDNRLATDTDEEKILTNAIQIAHLPGNARKDSPESVLLLYLIRQYGSHRAQCAPNDCLEALSILAEDFESPDNSSEDCLGDDAIATEFSQSLGSITHTTSFGQAFSIWAARVLGRAFASTGLRPSRIATEQSLRSSNDGPVDTDGVISSHARIADCLSELLFSRNAHEAGLAEHTLRRICMSFHDAEDALAFERLLQPDVAVIVSEGCFGYKSTHFASVRDSGLALEAGLEALQPLPMRDWVAEISIVLCSSFPKVPVVSALVPVLKHIHKVAVQLLPCIVHILLTREVDSTQTLKPLLSNLITKCLENAAPGAHAKQRFLLRLLLYLRGKVYPGEVTKQDRFNWLDVDLMMAAWTGTRCGLPLSALMFAESATSAVTSSKRASGRSSVITSQPIHVPDSLLLAAFKQIDEPDSFYGIQHKASMDSVLERLDHESDGLRSLMFRSARIESQLQETHQLTDADNLGMIHSLSALNLRSLTLALSTQSTSEGRSCSDEVLDAAQRLQQWDYALPEGRGTYSFNNFRFFQELSRTHDGARSHEYIQNALTQHLQLIPASEAAEQPAHAWYRALAALTEVSEIMAIRNPPELSSKLRILQARQAWMRTARFEDAAAVMTNRQTLFGVLRQNKHLQDFMHLTERETRILEVESLLQFSRLARQHSQLQESLSTIAVLNHLAEKGSKAGLEVHGAVKIETAAVLWDAGQVATAVTMLRDVLSIADLEDQDLASGRSHSLAQLGHWTAKARLEKPELILSNYLESAIQNLHGNTHDKGAGKVYFQFAAFCDAELQSPGNMENFTRAKKLRQGKDDEIQELKQAIKVAKKSTSERRELERSLVKAQKWFHIDDTEYQRLKDNRDMYIHQSLRNYLLALQVSDEHDICVLRFFALWLENAGEVTANEAIEESLDDVPCWKFVLLMNQLTSRVGDESSAFQKSLQRLVIRLCREHPYHSLHHLYASVRKPSTTDVAAYSRYKAAKVVYQNLQTNTQHLEILRRVFHANNHFNTLACASPDVQRGSSKIAVKDFPPAAKVAASIPSFQVPCLTANIPLNPNNDYSGVPVVVKYGPTVSVMHGVSAPKLMTAICSNGKQFKQLFKSGNDDLRQDAIMEQVFEEVSKMLQNHKATRQRDLKVRTYKVIPLTNRSGVIEFVPNSIPLNEYLRPAHLRYHPQDYKDSKARDIINVAAQHSVDTRIKEFRKVCEHMHPVLRHFFFERFHDPDEWFERRTAYTRTTASVSMLGHVLGLGDRHCHNILLDEKTGEVVHIDLGVAFEAGRVLPIPELVPFRLTRDIIDGMGATKIDGVFRRCCEFTMEALRRDKDSIMTLLNVLRYDPLYTWTLSPVRARRMQEAQDTEGEANNINAEGSALNRDHEAGEADRALSIVEKKLSTDLSTEATVNELIQQATDERNLATLFHGWAAYF